MSNSWFNTMADSYRDDVCLKAWMDLSWWSIKKRREKQTSKTWRLKPTLGCCSRDPAASTWPCCKPMGNHRNIRYVDDLLISWFGNDAPTLANFGSLTNLDSWSPSTMTYQQVLAPILFCVLQKLSPPLFSFFSPLSVRLSANFKIKSLTKYCK